MPSQRPLFGGALSCSIPPEWRDLSDIRQVPDHQECFILYDESNSNEGSLSSLLLVIEILEHNDGISDAEAPRHFFDDIAQTNGSPATKTQFETIQDMKNYYPLNLPHGASVCGGTGAQHVLMGRDTDFDGKPRQQPVEATNLYMAAIRLPSVGSDILFTLTVPSENPRNGGSAQQAFQGALSSFQVHDWSLFG